MKKEIIDVDKTKGIVRVTTSDERYYIKPGRNTETGLPTHKYYPSSSWISSYYYMDPYLIKWIAKQGLEEADAIKMAAGEKGSRIHQASELLDRGGELHIGQKFILPDDDKEEELTMEEYDAMVAYKNWFEKSNVKILANEMSVFNESEEFPYAGTLDKIIAITNDVTHFRQIYVLDVKTSKGISDTHIMQVSSYSHADIDYKSMGITEQEWKDRKLCILQLAYPFNKNRYKFTEIEDKFDDFINICYRTWKKKNPDSSPKQVFLPLSIKLNLPVEEKVDKKETKIKTKIKK